MSGPWFLMWRKARRAAASVARSINSEVSEWFRAGLRAIPGETGCGLRNRLYGYHAGRRCRVLSHVFIYHPRNLVLGENVWISPMSQVNAGGGIRIGKNVLIGPGCMIWSQNHRYSSADCPVCEQGYDFREVVIEDDVWMGAGAIVLPGVCLRRGTVVAAGAVVTHSTEPYTLVAGIPATCIGSRFSVRCDSFL
jgi:acetyltransferase-like isoleucine patch superfamily enzyme